MNAIVVVDRNWAIGRNNALLFSLPTDAYALEDIFSQTDAYLKTIAP